MPARDSYADLAREYAAEVREEHTFNAPGSDRKIVRTVRSGTNETPVPRR